MFKNALVSVSNKSEIENFIKPLQEKFGTRILSTGGTAKHLSNHGVKVVDVSEQTGFPEVMDGRVKTLHPNIHMCLLARKDHAEDSALLKEYNLEPIDLVVGNLYPFEEALHKGASIEELPKFIDIGGPSFLRAAAKSYNRIAVVCDPNDYSWILESKELSLKDRKYLSAKLFDHVSTYDSMIARTLQSELGPEFSQGGKLVQELRYGENPQQKSKWYRMPRFTQGLHSAKVLQGKALSYNNLLDLDAAVATLREFPDQACCVSLKHSNPCGVALDSKIELAVEKSLQADPVSVFGGIVALNQELNASCAEKLVELFIECVVAPSFTKEALDIFSKKKNLRLLEWNQLMDESNKYNFKSISGGFLVQESDKIKLKKEDCEFVGDTPDDKTWLDIELAWKVCAHLKSNAISLVSGQKTVGLGMGQVNRVDAVAQAVERQKQFHPKAVNLVLASDAFFPFADSIKKASEAGVSWIVQPGGSIRDDEVKACALELGVNLILTGTRHFLH